MKLVKSPLNLREFYILDSKYNFIDPEANQEIDANAIFEKYHLDFDFMVQEQENGEYFLFTKIHINTIDAPICGYSLLVEAVTVYTLTNPENLTEKEKADLIYISGLSISINNLRNYISNMSMYFPFGKYQLPAIDIMALHQEKSKKTKKSKSKK